MARLACKQANRVAFVVQMTPRMNHSVRCQASPDDQQPQGNDVGPPALCGRLLVAEDSSAFRYLLASALRADGHDVVEVSNGVDLMDMLGGSLIPEWGAAPFDLVLSDVRMPGWSGIDALASLGHEFPLPPVVLMTAFGDDELHRRAKSAGAMAVLDKPIDVDDLRRFVIQFLRRKVH